MMNIIPILELFHVKHPPPDFIWGGVCTGRHSSLQKDLNFESTKF